MGEQIEELFPEIEHIIRGYDKESEVLSIDSVSIENYPKVFTLCSASVFEKRIKDKLRIFLNNPQSVLSLSYPGVVNMINRHHDNAVDKIFAKLKAYNANGIDCLDASGFYDLFGGVVFKNAIATEYDRLREEQKNSANAKAIKLFELISMGYMEYENSYAILIDMVERLDLCTFDRAEEAYLSIKLRRNKVAHNYITELLDSFNDLRAFYYGAALYIASVDTILSGMVSQLPVESSTQ